MPERAGTVPRRDPDHAGPGPSLRRLLVPLDGSRLAEATLPVATRLSGACGSTLVLLHVLERNLASQVHGERHLTRLDEADAYLAHVAQRLGLPEGRVELHTHDVRVGDVAESIAQHADEHGIDLIVLCTHGEGGLRDVLWGSIAQQVLQRSTRPVLLVRARPSRVPEAFEPRTLMVPMDGTAGAEAALPYAARLAVALGATLRLVLVVPTIETVSAGEMAAATFLPSASRAVLDVEEAQSRAYLEGLAATTDAMGATTVTEVRRGEPVAQLATDRGEHDDGLVVIATHGRAGLQAIWNRSVAARLLRRTDAPILLVPIQE
jgi:nucleotide-binding universal stress UspA family protein